MGWRLTAASLVLAAASASHAASSDPARVERGRALYEAHCHYCHTDDIHRRQNRIPLTRDELLGIVDHFRRTSNQGWTPQEIEDVTDYLNQNYYRLGR